jgi:carbamoyl-phosphate synthase large subunit
MAAVSVLSGRQLAPYARVLAEWALAERDREVRLILAHLIDANHWEPSPSRLIANLRIWATETLAEPGLNRSDPAGGKPSEPDGTAAMTHPTLDLQSSLASLGPVAVTGAGGPAGVAVIRALRAAGLDVIGLDSDPTAVGISLANHGAVIPRADEESFVEDLASTLQASGARALMVTIAEEISPIWDGIDRLRQAGVAFWLPSPSAVESCLDKWAFAERLRSAGFRGPETGLGSADGVPGPWIVKPRFGRGSRNIMPAESPEEVRLALKQVPDAIVQRRLDGQEFTVDALIGPDHLPVTLAPRWRLETRGGISTKGQTFVDDGLADEVSLLSLELGLEGPINIQGFIDYDGIAWFTEINPRFSGGLSLTLAAGCDLVGQYLAMIHGLPPDPSRLSVRVGVSMLRYFEEIVVDSPLSPVQFTRPGDSPSNCAASPGPSPAP